MDPKEYALYVHVPVCPSKCAYCDFVSERVGACDTRAVADALIHDIEKVAGALADARARTAHPPLHSVYIGGGTPTALGESLLDVIDAITEIPGYTPGIEFTVETNPDTTDDMLIEHLVERGVNRFSLGVQSFDDAELSLLGRAHDSSRALEAIETLTGFGDTVRVSIDLIAGIPGQTAETWAATLHEATEAARRGVGHVSVYPLTVEEGTVLDGRIERGEVEDVDEDFTVDALLFAEDTLVDAGFTRYEIANYAVGGQEAVHNMAYWSGIPYLGIGPSAASMCDLGTYDQLAAALGWEHATDRAIDHEGRVRFTRVSDIETYQANPLATPEDIEVLSSAQIAREDLMLGLRKTQGVSQDDFKAFLSAEPHLEGVVDELISRGLLERTQEGALKMTGGSWLLGNEVFGAIWND